MSSLAPLDLSDLDLPFQLPPSSHVDRSPLAAASSAAANSSTTVTPSRPCPAPTSLAPCSSQESFELPHSSTCTCGCLARGRARPPTVAKEPAMARKKRASPSDPSPLIAPAPSRRADSSGSGPVPDAPLKALPWLHHDSPEPQPEQGASYGTRSGRTTRSTPQNKQSPKTKTGSLKIVLKAPKRTGPPPTLLPTPVSSASPPVVILDSSGATSEASSRSESPAIPPSASAAASNIAIEAVVTPMPASYGSSTVIELDTPPGSAEGTPVRAGSVDRSASRKGPKIGRDGLNRVCHHHKSQTDRLRMICKNAPTCRTVWCKNCVEKHYLTFTPNAQFEPGIAFACPVCQDACMCAGCKRKRLIVRRENRKPLSDADLVIALSIPTTPAPPTALAESKAEKRERKKKARESGNVAVDLWTPNGAGWAPSPAQEGGSDSSDDDEDVSRMLIGDAVATKEAPATTGAAAGGNSTSQPAQAPTPDDDSTLIAKRRSSLTSAYDRENPVTFPSAPPAPPKPKPVPIRQNRPPGRRRSSAATNNGPRGRSATQTAAAAAAAAAAAPPVDNYSHYTTVSIFASAPTPGSAAEPAPSAASTRPRRNKRPSTAFDDYAVDFATSAAAGLVDRSASPGPASFAAAAAHTAATSRRGRGSAASVRGALAGRLSIDMFAPSRKSQRKWRSDLSSASDCDGSAYSSGDDADSDVDFTEADAAAAVKPVMEQPLPVLAGLERNLGIEPADGDGPGPGAEPLAFGEAFTGVVAHDLLGAAGAGARPRRSVRWIEGPERRKRRTMAAAAAAVPQEEEEPDTATVTPSEPTFVVKKEPEQPDATLEAPQTTRSVSPCDPHQLFSPPPLKRSTSLPPGPAAKVPSPKRKDDRPPPYEALRSSEQTPASSDGAVAENRSAKDVKLAFALLDAVRAAVGSVIGSPARGESSSAGIGAALQAALTTGHSATSSPSAKVGSDAMQLDSEAMPSSSADAVRHDSTEGGTIDYQAHELEAKRRLEALAAQEQVDPGKAFKPTARDGAEAQLFIGSPACHVDVDDEVVEAHLTGVKSEAITDRKFGFEVSFRVSTVETPDFDTDSPIDDLWTPASAADSISTAPSTSASNSFGEDPLCASRHVSGPTDADSPASPALVDEYPLFAAAVAGGLTPPQGGSAVAIPRTPTRGLLASGALRGLEDLDVVGGASGLAVPLHSEDTWMDERDTEIEAF
ncbi:hypothetical protein JCM10908_001109 [Rhodotorula pacifica]|uniref:uncharacterized protein n=1 Tax=Rhodotorula pacifica TaxID=1495444 RepID=UPI0031754E45